MIKTNISLHFVAVSIMCITMAFRNDHKRVVCFGDSITYGAMVDGHSWVWTLSQEHPGIDFINAGRSGRKTADKEELLPVLKQNPTADYYLIFLGVNDLKNGTDSMVTNCGANIQWMIAAIRKANNAAKIVVLAPVDINLETMNEINTNKKYNENTKRSLYKLATVYKQLAWREHTEFISLLHAVSKQNYVDGLHPNNEGQQQIANAVWKKLKKIIN
ncbi:MAG: SGNH/GDSL hydrolase family protein [Bacteroidota bacterium]